MSKVGGMFGGICDPTLCILRIFNPFFLSKKNACSWICNWITNPKNTRTGIANPSGGMQTLYIK